MQYKIYVIKQRKGGSERVQGSETTTYYPDVARAAFWAAYNDPRFTTSDFLLLLTSEHKQICAYRFTSKPGDRDYIESGQEIIL
jgi:hypothetical protein